VKLNHEHKTTHTQEHERERERRERERERGLPNNDPDLDQSTASSNTCEVPSI